MHGFMYIPSKRRAVKIDCKMNLVFVGYIRDSLDFRINWVIAIVAVVIMGHTIFALIACFYTIFVHNRHSK